MTYRYEPPVDEFDFLLRHVVGAEAALELAGGDLDLDDAREVMAEAGRLAADVLDPLNRVADQQGVRLVDGVVSTSDGFKRAYDLFVAGGWTSAALPEEIGGGAMPRCIEHALLELWAAPGISFALFPGLTTAAVYAIAASGDEDLRRTFIPPMVEGRWSGTMNLTEPQAGTDLAAIRTAATPRDDGTWCVRGQKMFITWGEHDLSENIVHMVLARTPDAPDRLGGLSLFVVPKFLPQGSGIGPRNAVDCIAVEKKLGIHGSPTCVMAFNDAVGYLVGEVGQGVPGMFVMMNVARVGIGIQALGVADRARQHAVSYAAERVQGRVVDRPAGTAIDQHPDVRRLLLRMGSAVDAMRALSLQIGVWLDFASHGTAEERAEAHALAEFFTPIFKSWSSEQAQIIAYDGVQVHGGTGFIEETGAAQYSRDARILPIYEGTTAIQANDLVGRKVLRDAGETADRILSLIAASVQELAAHRHPVGDRLASSMRNALDLTRASGEQLLARGARSRDTHAVSVPYLMLWGALAGGWMHTRILLADQKLGESPEHLRSADAFAALHLSEAPSLSAVISAGEIA